jgi:hypothetical protein
MKPAGIEELSSDEEGDDAAAEDPAQVTELTTEDQVAAQAERKRKAIAALAQTNLEVCSFGAVWGADANCTVGSNFRLR